MRIRKISQWSCPTLQKVCTWLVGLAEVSGSAVLTPVSHIVGSAAAHLLSWIRRTEQAVAGQSKANQRTQLSQVSWIWNNLFYSRSKPCFKNQCCGSGIFFPDPDFYPSRTPDPKTATKERGEKN
jgi:hypothetical protein